MSKKRRREADAPQADRRASIDAAIADTKKRKREVDVELVKVYEDLADEEETVRLAAAHTLLSKIYKPGVTNDEQTKTILTRLFRGLCSGRKSARLGFSVALTELLSQLASSQKAAGISAPVVIDILEAQSVTEKGVSSQDERDHYFGRIFGAEAILKAGLLFQEGNQAHFERLLGFLLDLALKKPWLRQECGWVLFNCLGVELNGFTGEFAKVMVERLVSEKLIRTPEGLAIWVAATRRFPKMKLPKSAWKSGDPLARKDVKILADILKDARAHPDQEQFDLGAQGSARWSANLHFAWNVILVELFRSLPVELQNGKDLENKASMDKSLTFDLFWNVVVDEGLFASSNSAERKAWGFSLWRKVFETAPQELLIHTFTTQATNWLTKSLKSSERLLQKTAQKVVQSIQARFAGAAAWSAAGDAASSYVRALLQSVSYGDYDQITRSKTLRTLIESLDPAVLYKVSTDLTGTVREHSPQDDPKATLQLQKTAISLQWKIVSTRLRHWEESQWSNTNDVKESDWDLVSSILQLWTREVCVSPHAKLAKGSDKLRPVFLPPARDFAKERLNLGFEQGLKLGSLGCKLLETVLLHIQHLESTHIEMAVAYEHDVQKIVQNAWQRLLATQIESSKTSRIEHSTRSSRNPTQTQPLSLSEAFRLLYCLLLLQIYCGETEAVSILQEVLEYHSRLDREKSSSQAASLETESADGFMEVLLSFASRPSKLLRRITVQLFEAFAPYLTVTGVEGLCRVLGAKENLQGQQEMFQGEDADMVDSDQSVTDSVVEAVDSDVDVESLSSNHESERDSLDGSDSEEEDDDDDDEEEEEEEEEEDDDDADDEELAKFDAALASALGTRSLSQNDLAATSDTSSDEDMDDEQMMELDSKLAEVFRARNEQQSKARKKDAKEAKETVVNFKNRVQDLVESYFKRQQRNPLSIDFLLPMLKLIRTTQTKQLADRSCNIIQQFCTRCKGPNVPELLAGAQTRHAIDVLRSIHEEASTESSNAHSSVASLSSILVVKALVKTDAANVKEVVEIYASTRMKQLTEKKCHILPGFFTDWNNWCQTAKEKLGN